MAEKLNIEHERKLVTILTRIKEISEVHISDESIQNKRDQAVEVIQSVMTPLGMAIRDRNECENDMHEVFNDAILSSVYKNDDPMYHHIKDFMRLSKNVFLLQEQIMQRLAVFVKEILVWANDIRRIPMPDKTLDDGIPKLTEEERQELKRRVHTMILGHQRANLGKKKVFEYQLYSMANTKEKYDIINSIWFEISGEYYLDKLKKERESRENSPPEAPQQEEVVSNQEN